MTAPPIVLFDLDGTVLTFVGPPPGPGRISMDRMMRELFGAQEATAGVRLAGSTDHAIVRAMLAKIGREAEHASLVAEALAVYLRNLRQEVERKPYRAIGDVRSAVVACEARGARVGLGTGNVREGAEVKLASAGLHGVFDCERGGYGSDAEERVEILLAAVARCGGGPEDSVPLVIVGDTVSDVRAGRALSARIVGVAASEGARRELSEAGADAIVQDCGPALVDAIFG